MANINFSNLFSQEQILEIFPAPGQAMSAEAYHDACGNPKGPAAVLAVASRDPPPKYESREAAIAAGAVAGARTAHWLCVAIVAKAAFESGVRADDGSRNGNLHRMWRTHRLFDEFADLCLS
jgi:hypothetical protein